MRALTMIAISAAMVVSANAAEIKFAPADFVVLNQANNNVSDLVVHAIGVATGPRETLTIDRIEIALMRGDHRIARCDLDPLRAVTDMLTADISPERYLPGGQLLSADGVKGFFGRDVTQAARPPRLGPSEYIFTTRHYFAVNGPLDAVRVTVEGKDADGKPVVTTADLPVRNYRPSIPYRMPLEGAWMMHALPSASHHRMNAATEFAVDFFKTDGEGRNLVGDPVNPANALGYGAPVLAAADGEVVFIIADDVQDRTLYMPKPGEPGTAREKRIGAVMSKRLKENVRRAVAGNLVTIRHEANGVVEYTSYGHLKAGSVRVKKGERVTQGQVIGEVGDTGDSPATHLHFQMNAGPDAFTSKSLPAEFVDIKYPGHSRDPGRFVIKAPPK